MRYLHILACRWVCKHYGTQKKSTADKNKGVRKNQAILPNGCKTQILVSFNKLMGAYVIKTLKLTHSHPIGEAEYGLYAANRRPTAQLRETAETMLENGANPTMVMQFLVPGHGKLRQFVAQRHGKFRQMSWIRMWTKLNRVTTNQTYLWSKNIWVNISNFTTETSKLSEFLYDI